MLEIITLECHGLRSRSALNYLLKWHFGRWLGVVSNAWKLNVGSENRVQGDFVLRLVWKSIELSHGGAENVHDLDYRSDLGIADAELLKRSIRLNKERKVVFDDFFSSPCEGHENLLSIKPWSFMTDIYFQADLC